MYACYSQNGDFSPGNGALLANNYFESPQGAMWNPNISWGKMQSNYLTTKKDSIRDRGGAEKETTFWPGRVSR